MGSDTDPHRGSPEPGSLKRGTSPGTAPLADTVSNDAPRLPAVRIGLAGGLVGMLCCVGPTVLALIGVVGAGTALSWADDLYGGYAWWFRLGGLAVMAGLVVWALRRRRSCSLGGVRAARWKLALMVGVGVLSYGVFYGLTAWAGTYAT